MKMSLRCMAATLLLLSVISMPLNAVTGPSNVPIDSTKTLELAEVTALTRRLEEIKGMDKSKLTSPERKQLRKEVRAIKKTVANNGGGIYLSVGAILIIVLLLVLLL